MKKIISVLMAVTVILMLSACNGNSTLGTTNSSESSDNAGSAVTNENNDNTNNNKSDSDDFVILNSKNSTVKFAIFADSHVGRQSIVNNRVKRTMEWVNTTDDLDFLLFLGDNIENGYFDDSHTLADQLKLLNEITLNSKVPYYYTKGNHDAKTAAFHDNIAVVCGDVAVVTFFASYYCPDPDDIYLNNGLVSEETLIWLENTFEKCAGKRIILACHFSIVNNDSENFTSPIGDARVIPKRNNTYVDFGRETILNLAEKYNIELYFNGHEHNAEMPVGNAGTLTDYNLPGLGINGTFVTVTVGAESAIIELRDNRNADDVIKSFNYKFTREIVG